MHSSSFLMLLPPPFINLGARFPFKGGGGCNTPCYGSPNSSLITIISGLVMQSCLNQSIQSQGKGVLDLI
jgi:hypothetical protein